MRHVVIARQLLEVQHALVNFPFVCVCVYVYVNDHNCIHTQNSHMFPLIGAYSDYGFDYTFNLFAK